MGTERIYTIALGIVRELQAAGHRALFVGGCVRDELLGIPLKDIDIATDAHPDRVLEIFPDARLVGAKFGVVVVSREEFSFEVATFRKDGVYVDHRHPASVSFGRLEDDVRRRDFTINALFHDPISGEIIDRVGGREDLKNGLIRCIDSPQQRFQEDALRLLRAIRFAARLGFAIHEDTMTAMEELAPTIQYISAERHREELTRILLGPRAGAAFHAMLKCGLLRWLLPEVEALHGVEQGREHHPEGDVFTHTMLVVDFVEPRTVQTVWGALLHDIGKAVTFHRDPTTGKISFHNHAHVGGCMARQILNRLKFSTEDTATIVALVARHMHVMDITKMKASTLRRFLGAPTIEGDLAVHRADCLGSSGNLAYWDFANGKLAEFRARQEELLPKPLITGRDLIACGVKPGAAMGAFLRGAHEAQLGGAFSTREQALDWLKANPPA